ESFSPVLLRLAAGFGEPDLTPTWGRLDPDLPSFEPDFHPSYSHFPFWLSGSLMKGQYGTTA
ncbi:hypothetical protein, partial [Photorhabdus viridis]|uniref:hypothetical protein n=1 Tax=Photorhabdus viridis TaxID=3163327 RepID=UPI0033074336